MHNFKLASGSFLSQADAKIKRAVAYPPHRQLLDSLKHDPIRIFEDHDLAFAEIAHVPGFNWPGQVAGEQEAGPQGEGQDARRILSPVWQPWCRRQAETTDEPASARHVLMSVKRNG